MMGSAVLLIASAISTASPIETQSLSAAQMLVIADRALAHGKTALAEQIYRAMFADPLLDVRLEARFRVAKIESRRGNLEAAAILFREVIDARPNAVPARLELARILDRLGDKDAAWRQIRAIHAAGLPPAVAHLVDRYSEALRNARPFGGSVEIAIAPDSNINRATRSATLGTVLGNFDIADDAKAKSGIGLALSGQAYRRLALGTDHDLLMRFSAYANLYRREAFDDMAADLAVGPEFNFRRARLQLEVGATQRWFGQKPFMRSLRIGNVVSQPLGGRTLVRLSSSAALVDNQINNLEDGKVFWGQLGIEHALTPTSGIAVRVAIDRQALKEAAYSTTGWRAGLTAWHDLGRATITAEAEVGGLRADDRLLLFPQKRVDRYSRLSLGATFRQLQFHGLAPLMRLSLERNRSSIAFYDYRRTRADIGFSRAF